MNPTPAQPARYPSAEVLAHLALERQAGLLQQADALDTKAATLVGLIGVLLGLLFGSDFVLDHWNTVLTVGTGLLVVAAAILALGVFFPRRYLLNPDIRALSQRFMGRDPDDTRWAITQSVNRALPQIQRVLARKAFLVGGATLMLVVALGLIGGRLIYSIERTPEPRTHVSPTPKRASPDG